MNDKKYDLNNICVLDIETTGINIFESEIIEIFILKIENNLIIDSYYSLFKPSKPILNSRIHGITDSVVENSPKILEKKHEIINFLDGFILVGHNINNFDIKFLNHFLNHTFNNLTIDTVKLSKTKLGKKLENHKLSTIAKFYGLDEPKHNAKNDVMVTFEIYKKLMSIK